MGVAREQRAGGQVRVRVRCSYVEEISVVTRGHRRRRVDRGVVVVIRTNSTSPGVVVHYGSLSGLSVSSDSALQDREVSRLISDVIAVLDNAFLVARRKLEGVVNGASGRKGSVVRSGNNIRRIPTEHVNQRSSDSGIGRVTVRDVERVGRRGASAPARVVGRLDVETFRPRVGVCEGVGQPRRHICTGNGRCRREGRNRLSVTGDSEVEDLNDGVVTFEGHCA